MAIKKIVGEEKKSQLQSVMFSDRENCVVALKKNNIDNYDKLESYKRLRKKRVKIACVRFVIWLITIFVIPFLVFFTMVTINPRAGHSFFGVSLYVVMSNSMEPEIMTGDCIVVKKVSSIEDIKVGSDITFVRNTDGQTVTHRVINVTYTEDGSAYYVTKGLHNPTADDGVVAFENVLGVRVQTISWLGQIIYYFRTPIGIVTMLAIFVLIAGGFYLSFRMSNDIRAVGK